MKAIRLCWFSDESGNSAEDGRGGEEEEEEEEALPEWLPLDGSAGDCG